jgi:hypothetical protein
LVRENFLQILEYKKEARKLEIFGLYHS